MVQQKGKNPRWLLLNTGQRAVLVEFECLLVELEFPKQNQGHMGERREPNVRDYSSFVCS